MHIFINSIRNVKDNKPNKADHLNLLKPHLTPTQISSMVYVKETKIWTKCLTNIYKYVFNIIICLEQMDRWDKAEKVLAGFVLCHPNKWYPGN